MFKNPLEKKIAGDPKKSEFNPPPRPKCVHCEQNDATTVDGEKFGHGYPVCSDECGFEFKNSPKRLAMDLAMVRHKRAHLEEQDRQLQAIESRIASMLRTFTKK